MKKAITINLVLNTETAYIEYLDTNEQYGEGRTVFVNGSDEVLIYEALEIVRNELKEMLD